MTDGYHAIVHAREREHDLGGLNMEESGGGKRIELTCMRKKFKK